MHALSQSAFLQALGYAIANSLWQVALLWIAVVLLNGLFKFSSAAKYKVAMYAQFAGFAWFLITLQFYYKQCSAAIAQTQALTASADNAAVSPNLNNTYSLLINAVIRTEQLLPYLSFAYLCLLILLLARLVKNYRSAQYIKKEKLRKTEVHWKLFVKRISGLLNIKPEVKIYLSEIVKSPLTIGFLKPVILIPVASMNNLSTEQMEAVILHELAHIKRADYLINLFHCVIETGLFFNPFTQLLSRIVKKERENSCDDWVLQFQYKPEMYAEALLRIASFQTQTSFAMHAAKNKGDLLSRVKRMIGRNEKTFNYRQQIFALLLMTFILSSFALLQPAAKQNAAIAAAKEIKKGKIAPAVIVSVENPLFSPAFFLSKPIKEQWSKALGEVQENNDRTKVAVSQIDFKKIIPYAFAEIKNINFLKNKENFETPALQTETEEMNFDNVFNKINDSLKNVISNIHIPDTDEIRNSLNFAAEQIRNADFKNLIEQSLNAAKTQLEKMQEQELSAFNQKKMKDAAEHAFALLKKSYRQKISASAASEDEMNSDTEREKLHQQLNRLQQRIDSLNEHTFISYNNEWKTSYSTYIKTKNAAEAPIKFSYAIAADNSTNQDSTVILRLQNKISKKSDYSGDARKCEKNNVHVIKTENGNSINITIEIF